MNVGDIVTRDGKKYVVTEIKDNYYNSVPYVEEEKPKTEGRTRKKG